MPVQRSKFADVCSGKLQDLLRSGSFICIGIAYPERAIDCIDVRLENGSVDRDAWNIYAREYHKLNRFLNDIRLSKENPRRKMDSAFSLK